MVQSLLTAQTLEALAPHTPLSSSPYLDTEDALLISGTVPVDDLNDRFGLQLPEEDYNTVAGYVMGRLGRIARKGDEIEFEGGRLRVLAMDGLRIDRLALALTALDDDLLDPGSD